MDREPSADEWIRKLWYVYTMEYYSAIKKNTFEAVLMRWMKLEAKGLSRVFCNTIVQKHQFFGAPLSSQSNSHILT